MPRLALPLHMVCLLLGLLVAGPVQAGDWPQFRGPQGTGRATGADSYPAEIGPQTNVLWKVAAPQGHSSPIVHGDRVYLTGVRDGRLLTLAYDRATGRQLWEVEAPKPEKLEVTHRIGNAAQSTPVTDGERVVAFFGSYGLACYDPAGKLLWKRPYGPFKNDFGAGSSPIILGDRVILCQDHDTDSFLTALDKRTGDVLWTTDRKEFPRNYCTPTVWRVNGQDQIVLAATLRVAGYDPATGKELWTVRGISRTVCCTPTVGEDGRLYVAGWAAGGDPGEQFDVPPFDAVAPGADANQDGLLTEEELPKGAIRQRFSQADRDKSGTLTKAEYEYFRGLFDQSKNVVVAIKPGGAGDITATHVAWQQPKHVPFCASPVFANKLIFAVRDGGILAALDAETGQPHKQGRLGATQDYYASPVSADGKVYLFNEAGQVTVTTATTNWQILATAEFGEDVFATPALAGGKIYVRTSGHLYALGAAR